ncbi:MAG: glycosyltransferase family 39 protein [Kofleriaceae bacterium]
MYEHDRRRYAALLGLALVVGCAVRLVTYTGTIAADDLTHAWAAVHFWDDPIEQSMPTGADSAYTVNARRIGVNFPMWIAAELAGPSEASFAAVPLVFSLLGILAVAAWARVLAGPRAGVIAGWLWAVVPIDVWHATVFMQDNIFATVLAAGLAAMAWAERDDRSLGWFAAGVAVGYLQYVKENAVLLLAIVVVAGIARSWRARRIHRGTIWLLAGSAVIHLLAVGYFARVFGDPLYYVNAWFGRQAAVEVEASQPFPRNFLRLGLYLSWGGALGIGLPIAVGYGVRWLRRATDAPRTLRLQLAIIAAVQSLLVLHVLRWGAWTMRYLLQVTPALVALAAVGLATAWPNMTRRKRTWLIAGAIATTAFGLVFGHPQHGRFRNELLRGAYAAIEREIPSDVPVYVVANPARAAHYTDRVFDLYAHYRARSGGWHITHTPDSITRGVVVRASYERYPGPPNPPRGNPLFVGRTVDHYGIALWIDVRTVGL